MAKEVLPLDLENINDAGSVNYCSSTTDYKEEDLYPSHSGTNLARVLNLINDFEIHEQVNICDKNWPLEVHTDSILKV